MPKPAFSEGGERLLEKVYSKEKLGPGFAQPRASGPPAGPAVSFTHVKESLILNEFIQLLRGLNQSISGKKAYTFFNNNS